MAKTKKQGVNATSVWMILFAALWLTATVFLVIMYTGQEELRKENDSLQAAARKLISPSERNSIALARQASERNTVASLLEGARQETATLATGEPSDDPSVVRTKRDEFLETIRVDALVSNADDFDDLSLHEALMKLYAGYKTERALRDAAEKRVGELDTEVARLVQAKAEQTVEFERSGKDISEQLTQVESDHAAYREERDNAVAELEQEFDLRRTQSDADLTGARQRVAALKREQGALKERFAVQQEKFRELLQGPAALSTARQADGRVLTAVPGDDVVYIDLGVHDKLTLGLKFAVYASSGGIPVDGRAKGQIEVVSISQSSSQCLVVSLMPGAVVLEGDVIANPIYDANRSINFVVVGEFDLNHDGAPDTDGTASIHSMITTWGGKITPDLGALTDFVVIGAAPRSRPISDDLPPEERQRRQRMQDVRDAYMRTVSTARSLSVPVMNQEVFLNFLGYAGRYAGR